MEFTPTPHPSPADVRGFLAPFLGAPEDIFRRILHHTVHDARKFGVGKEEYAYDPPPSTLSPRAFANSILLSSKLFYNMGIAVLWADIVIRSPRALRLVVDQCQAGTRFARASFLHCQTKRLEIRILIGYDLPGVLTLLKSMRQLEVFLLRTFASPMDEAIPCSPKGLLDGLNTHCRGLIRVQLESGIEAPSPRDIFALLNRQPFLETLVILNLSDDPLDHSSAEKATVPPRPRRPLQTLSVGFALWDPIRAPQNRPALDELMHALASTRSLPYLAALELFDSTPAMRSMLATFGVQLGALLKVVSRPEESRPTATTLLDLCPNLTHLAWIIVDWNFLNPYGSVPLSHHNLKILVLGLCQPPDEDPALFTPHLQQLLYAVFVGDFPVLACVSVCPRGSRLPSIQYSDWFDHLRQRWAQHRVSLQFTPGG